MDANGYVSLLGGGLAVDQFLLDGAVAPGTNPAIPDAAGEIHFQGVTISAHGLPVQTFSRLAANNVRLEVQLASAVAATDALQAGLAAFDSSMFTVDANGFVQLIGGTLAIDSNSGDDAVVIFPAATGNFGWQGLTVANATHAKPVFFKDSATPNTIDLDVQVAAAITGAPGGKLDAGLSSYDDTQFTVDADGYVQIIGGGLTWVEETGATRALLVNQGVIGNRATAQTFTLPATAALGSIIRIVNKGAGLITIAQNAGQNCRLGDTVSTTGVGGTMTATATGDTIELVCTTANTDFAVLSSVGIFNLV